LKKLLLASLLIISSLISQAQPPLSLGWVYKPLSYHSNFGTDVSIDNSSNVYVTGTYRFSAQFDHNAPALYSNSVSFDVFIEKLDERGNFVWVKTIGGPNTEIGRGITTDTAHNVFVTGYYNDTVDFNPDTGVYSMSSNGGSDIFILKLDSIGDFLWAKSVGSSNDDSGFDLVSDDSGNVYIAGEYKGTVDFDPDTSSYYLTSNGNKDIFLLKLDPSGNFVWAKSFGSSNIEEKPAIDIDSQNNIFLTATNAGTLDGNPNSGTHTLSSKGSRDYFVVKLSSSGSFLWANITGGTDYDYSKGINVDIFDNVYVTGGFGKTVDFDPDSGTYTLSTNNNSNSEDIFIQKLDSGGNFLWARRIGGYGVHYGKDITSDTLGNPILTGVFSANLDANPATQVSYNLIHISGDDHFITKFDTSGNFTWARAFNTSNDDYSHSIAVDPNNNSILSTGEFSSIIDFDPTSNTHNVSSGSGRTLFLHKLRQCHHSTPSTDVINACISYTWIDGNTYTSNNNTATFPLANSTGCDSIITLDLTLTTIDTSINVNSPDLTSNANGASYQWLDCNNNYAIMPNDTLQTLNATASGDYAVEITKNGCVDTSACKNITLVGIKENKSQYSVEVFPNPTKGIINLDLSSFPSNKLNIKVYSIDGSLLGEQELEGGYVKQLNLKNHHAGIYFIELTSAGIKKRVKVVKY
jgi:hypothetical protein